MRLEELKKELKEEINLFPTDKLKKQIARTQQKIDNYAVEFAKWCRRNQHSYDLSPYSYKELLEIFKKEKGL